MFGQQNGNHIYFRQQAAVLERYQQSLEANLAAAQPTEVADTAQLDDCNGHRERSAAVSPAEHLAQGPEAPQANGENSSQRSIPQEVQPQNITLSGITDGSNRTPGGAVLNNCHIGNFYSITATGSGSVNIPAPNPTPRNSDHILSQRNHHHHHHRSGSDADESSAETTTSSPSLSGSPFRSQPPWSPILTRRMLRHGQRRPHARPRSHRHVLDSGSSTSLGSMSSWRRSSPGPVRAYRVDENMLRAGLGFNNQHDNRDEEEEDSDGDVDMDQNNNNRGNGNDKRGNDNDNNPVNGNTEEGGNSGDSDTICNNSDESIV
ncbi:hypothetical protein VTJ49DRAFT_6061 [Mycothermus thermophilus]|uniref:Uncharacterized protein n=1 Tax=Humicola insolens TaxID=85995 RepID=A0ABR3VJK9_HUMIN